MSCSHCYYEKPGIKVCLNLQYSRRNRRLNKPISKIYFLILMIKKNSFIYKYDWPHRIICCNIFVEQLKNLGKFYFLDIFPKFFYNIIRKLTNIFHVFFQICLRCNLGTSCSALWDCGYSCGASWVLLQCNLGTFGGAMWIFL